MTLCTAFRAAILLAAATVFFASPAAAKMLPFQTPGQLKAKCQAAGGLYGPPSKGGVYSCVMDSGTVVACGGQGEDAKTCETGDNPIERRGKAAVVRDHRAKPVVRDHRDAPIVRDHRQ